MLFKESCREVSLVQCVDSDVVFNDAAVEDAQSCVSGSIYNCLGHKKLLVFEARCTNIIRKILDLQRQLRTRQD